MESSRILPAHTGPPQGIRIAGAGDLQSPNPVRLPREKVPQSGGRGVDFNSEIKSL